MKQENEITISFPDNKFITQIQIRNSDSLIDVDTQTKRQVSRDEAHKFSAEGECASMTYGINSITRQFFLSLRIDRRNIKVKNEQFKILLKWLDALINVANLTKEESQQLSNQLFTFLNFETDLQLQKFQKFLTEIKIQEAVNVAIKSGHYDILHELALQYYENGDFENAYKILKYLKDKLFAQSDDIFTKFAKGHNFFTKLANSLYFSPNLFSSEEDASKDFVRYEQIFRYAMKGDDQFLKNKIFKRLCMPIGSPEGIDNIVASDVKGDAEFLIELASHIRDLKSQLVNTVTSQTSCLTQNGNPHDNSIFQPNDAGAVTSDTNTASVIKNEPS